MPPYAIRIFGDPVLKQRAAEVSDIDGRLARLAQDMITTMYEAPGLGLAAPQVGVQKRLFVYDLQDEKGPHVIVNPTISEVRRVTSGMAWRILRTVSRTALPLLPRLIRRNKRWLIC